MKIFKFWFRIILKLIKILLFLDFRKYILLNSTIYKEFVIDCIGKTTDFSREFMLRMSDKRAKGERGLMSYDPNIARGNFIEYKFEQADGLENN